MLGALALAAGHVSAAAPEPAKPAPIIQTSRPLTPVALSESHPVIPVPTSGVAGLAGMIFVTAYVLRHSARPVARHF